MKYQKYHFRKPELIPTIVMSLMVALMFALGIWQLERLQWKTALLARIETVQSQPPRNLLSYTTAELPKAEWHNIIVSGILLNDKELYATPRFYKEQLGYAVLTPLAISTSTGIQYILINRGWVPPEKKDPELRAKSNINSIVTIDGVIRNTLPQGLFRPNNNPDKNIWFWYDIPAMAKYINLPLLPVIIDATQIKKADIGTQIVNGPIPFPIEITIRNDHLGYAITWFLIGISGIVIYVLYYTERKL